MIPEKHKNKLILILVIILAIAIIFLGYAVSVANDGNSDNISLNSSNEDYIDYSLPSEPTANAKIDTSDVGSQLLGRNDLGSVEVLGPFGNPNSDVKIAYSIGMHPWESKVHKALFDTLKYKNRSLNCCYYIYKIGLNQFLQG